MKKALLLIWIVLFSFAAQAQMYFMPQGTTNNIYPFGSNAPNNKVQWLYLPADFTTVPPGGTITKVYFRTWNNLPSYTATYSNFSIRMLNTVATTFASSTYVVGTTTVFTGNPVVVPSTGPYTWFSFTLTTPFVYTGQNLILEVEQNNMVGQIYANCKVAPGRRIFGTYGAPTGTLSADVCDFGFDILTSCDSPINIQTNATRFTADITWDPRPGATTYEYLIDQSPLNPTSTGYTYTNSPVVNLKNLPDGTCYYIHVRTLCGSTMMSGWSLDSFCTIADCKVPEVTIDNVLSTSAIARWDAVPGAYGYEYSTGTTPNPPTNGAHTIYTGVKLQGLTPNKTLYFYVRAKCTPTPLSEWGVTPFHTMATLGVDDVNNEELSVAAFPNPVMDVMRLEIHGKRGKNAMVHVTDVTGRVVYTRVVEAAKLEINMAGLAPGTYYLKYSDDSHKQLVKLTRL